MAITERRLELINYLSAPNHKERNNLLRWLYRNLNFDSATDQSIKANVERWVVQTEPCKDGVDRFNNAFPEYAFVNKLVKTFTVTVTTDKKCTNAHADYLTQILKAGLKQWDNACMLHHGMTFKVETQK